MVRSRVLSFISAFGLPKSDQATTSRNEEASSASASAPSSVNGRSKLAPANNASLNGVATRTPSDRPSLTRPPSMAFTYQPPQTEILPDTLPELLPIFTFLNSHMNKTYHEGYFLKLNDLDTQGRPCADRKWVECYASLVGTVLSIWDAATLDTTADINPTFINLADASIRMMEKLPTNDKTGKPLYNILSVSTAGKNRYLFHFPTFNALTQWTAGIRLALFEYTSLLEAYTGSIIAGKGKQLNNIRMIMERSRYKYEDWARVRFGAGTPWRRCWFVVSPPSDKDYQKAQKSKKRSAYDRTTPILTGDIKFYDTKKTKKAQPIATITDAYAAFALYPQSKNLIDQSTLVKIEGSIIMHSQSQSSTEGFVFVMPELHPAVSGLEIMLRFLFPVFDTFGLYGRPTRLIADTNNVKSLMFAFPKNRQYGYLDVLDVVNLINKSDSQRWSEKEWRTELREATGQRMSTVNSAASSIGGRPSQRSSIQSRRGKTRFQEPGQPLSSAFNHSAEAIIETPTAITESPTTDPALAYGHHRAVSDTNALGAIGSPRKPQAHIPSRLSVQDIPPEPPLHSVGLQPVNDRPMTHQSNETSSDSDTQLRDIPRRENIIQEFIPDGPPAPVAVPPAFAHQPGDVPTSRPQASIELRRANSRMSSATLAQLVDVNRLRGAAVGISDIQEMPDQDNYNTGSSGDLPPHPIQERPPPVPIHANTSNGHIQQPIPQRVTQDRASVHLDASQPIKRKPLPLVQPSETNVNANDLDSFQDSASVRTDLSLKDLQHTVDEAALNRILPMQPSFSRERAMTQMTQISRVDTESVYDDDRSASPDYASTRKSTETKRSEVSVTRPRMGVLKTVGDAGPEKQEVTIGDAHYFAKQETPKENPDLPTIDFGPTMSHNLHTRRPSLSDMLNIFGTNSESKSTPRRDGAVEGHARKPSRSPGEENKRRTMIWQPGLTKRHPESPTNYTVTPEQFVHQRSTSNSHPIDFPLGSPFSRSRSSEVTMTLGNSPQQSFGRELPPRPTSRGSTMLLNQNESPMRPHSRNSTLLLNQSQNELPRPYSRGSTMMLSQNDALMRPQSRNSTMLLNQNELPVRPHSRNSAMLLNQNETPMRPHSRNSAMMLNSNELPSRPHSWNSAAVLHQNDLSSHLSAREQEHVARMTGSSFFNISSRDTRPAANTGGLIGAIDAREREKKYMKEGLSNQMVQQAIAQRQHQQVYDAQQMHQSRVGSIYNMPGASYTWDALNQTAFNQTQMAPRSTTNVDWQTWNSPAGSQTPPPPATQQSHPYFQQYQHY